MLGGASFSMATPGLLRRMLTPSDQEFLDDLAQRSFRYFWEQADPHTGLVRERALGSRHDNEDRYIGSLAPTGFGLVAACIGAVRGWIPGDSARQRIRTTLRFFADHAPQQHGWFYHCMHMGTGERSGFHPSDPNRSELSSIDSALLLGGVLAARGCFGDDDAEIARLASAIYERMDFRWMLNGHPLLLSQGWTPEAGFIPYRWDSYCELTILYLLGIGSEYHPLNPDSWYAWSRDRNVYDGETYIGTAPLFTHQFSHAFIDYRGRREARGSRVNWFQNSVTATRAHRRFCLDLGRDFPGYTDEIWGVTSSDSANGYVAWGGPPNRCGIDGTVVPCAAGGSLMFTPDICVPALRQMHERFGHKIYGPYGFVDAFHPTNGWVSSDYLGIDVGITLLSAENLRSGNVWTWFMANPEVETAMKRIGLVDA